MTVENDPRVESSGGLRILDKTVACDVKGLRGHGGRVVDDDIHL